LCKTRGYGFDSRKTIIYKYFCWAKLNHSMLLWTPKFGNDCICIPIPHSTHACSASKFYKTNKYFHINKNNTGYRKALSLSLSLSLTYSLTRTRTCACARASLNDRANACSCLYPL
jgi:hypothetical protein